MDHRQYLEELLNYTASNNASDLHLSPGNYPVIRIDGRLIQIQDKKILDGPTLEGLVFALLGDRKDKFLSEKEADFSYDHSGTRFRANVYYSRGELAATLRLVPGTIKTPEELNLPPIIKIFSQLSQGFVLVVGPNGHGKSTTLASIIDLINKDRAEKIVTIEDPIEYVFTPEKSIIDQREVGQDTLSFHRALRAVFRQNVNVIMVGEMRD